MKIAKRVCATVLSVAFVVLSVLPVDAMPIQPPGMSANSDIIQVQARRPPSGGPSSSRPPSRPNASRRPPPGHWHGYRGSRYSRPGYRRHSDGWWYPAAAFAVGTMVGAAAARPAQPVHRHPSPSLRSHHVSWCMNRFRSYRVSDNTFQPYSGPRRQCVSPYSVH